MEGPYDVAFVDGTVERVTANNPDQAKMIAKNDRIQKLDPGGRRMKQGEAQDVLAHPSVKVQRVAQATLALLLAAAGALAAYLDAWLFPAVDGVLAAGVLQLVGASGTAIGATLAALTAVTGDTLIVPSFPESKKGWLLSWWTDVQVAGTARLRSAKFHDNVNGHRVDTVISELFPVWPHGIKHPLYTGDTLIAELAGSAVAGDIEYLVMLQYFDELQGQKLNGISYEDLQRRGQNVLTVENTIATGTTAAWAGGEAINAEIDQFKARNQYALIGYLVDTECAAVAWRGPNTGNLRVGGPGTETERDVTRGWFVDLARAYNMPLIPVIEADNKAATLIDALQDENGADTTVTSILVELSPS